MVKKGSETGDARHIYANPFVPAICPILALAIYTATIGFDSSNYLLPGNNQYDCYAKILGRAWITFGEKRCVHLCFWLAGWGLPGFRDTCVRYESAGDMIVGRFVAGLPFESANFTVLPPFFLRWMMKWISVSNYAFLLHL